MPIPISVEETRLGLRSYSDLPEVPVADLTELPEPSSYLDVILRKIDENVPDPVKAVGTAAIVLAGAVLAYYNGDLFN